jgi:hypothetical protein
MPKRIKPRFVWAVGVYREAYPDMPNDLQDVDDLVLWDREYQIKVATIHYPFAQAMCLEHVDHGMPFTHLEDWFNSLGKRALESEGIPS